MANVKQMRLIRGHQGSGKTTYAKTVYPNYAHTEADMFFVGENGEYHFDPMLLGKAHAWCLWETSLNILAAKIVVISNTFSKWWEIRTYRLLSDKYGYEFHTHIFICN